MTIQTQIERISTANQNIKASIVDSGVAVPEGTKIDGLAPLVGGIVGQFSDDLDLIIGADTTPIPDAIEWADKINGEDVSGYSSSLEFTFNNLAFGAHIIAYKDPTTGEIINNVSYDFDAKTFLVDRQSIVTFVTATLVPCVVTIDNGTQILLGTFDVSESAGESTTYSLYALYLSGNAKVTVTINAEG